MQDSSRCQVTQVTFGTDDYDAVTATVTVQRLVRGEYSIGFPLADDLPPDIREALRLWVAV